MCRFKLVFLKQRLFVMFFMFRPLCKGGWANPVILIFISRVEKKIIVKELSKLKNPKVMRQLVSLLTFSHMCNTYKTHEISRWNKPMLQPPHIEKYCALRIKFNNGSKQLGNIVCHWNYSVQVQF